jgi:hypothetical protein
MQSSGAMRREIAKLCPAVIASAAKHAPAQRKNGLLRGACHRACRRRDPVAGSDGLPCRHGVGSLRDTRAEDAEPTNNNPRQHGGN